MADPGRLVCTSCGADNRAGRRFCAQCGAALPVVCPTCGFANEAGEKFCGGCGGSLSIAPAPATQAGGDAAEAERRPVTVLFADLCGYTRLSQTQDPEDVHEMLERFFGVVDAIVERFGGRVDKHIGDAVMAIFGAPVAYGDDPARAVRAADAIVRAMPGIRAPSGPAQDVHVGIAAGEVVASGMGSDQHRAYTVIGPSVNLAARLVGIAGPGEVVLDDSVHDAIAREATCAMLEALAIKGIDRPITAWRLNALVAGGDAGAAAPFVGRSGELAQLTAIMQACVAGGAGTVVLVRGDPGIGKSRLVAEMRRVAVARGFACHTGLVLDFGTAEGRDPVRDIVASLVGLPPASSTPDRARALEMAIARGMVDADRRPFLADLLDLPLPAEGSELYGAMDSAARQRARGDVLIQLVETASRAAPVLITIEDLHWADNVTLTLVAALARATPRGRTLLVLTSRADGDPLSGGFRASLAGCALATLDIAPLTDADAVTLAGGLFATSATLARKCIQRAGGNPLFLEQLLRTAEESDDRLPASLGSLVLARVDRLPERERVALRAAAVLGQRFPLAALRHLIATPNYDCGALLAASLVRPDGEEFLFGHALIRDGVYASLTRTRRAELHRSAASWYGERDPTLHAEHLDRADAPEAARAYLAAARAQSDALHPERALALADRGAELAHEPADVYALNMLCGRLRCEAGEGKPTVVAYINALAAAAEPAERCWALLGIAAGHRLTASLDAALAALAEAEPIARTHGLTRELAELHHTRGNVQFARGEVAACRAAHEIALDCAHVLGDVAWEARAVSGLADASYATGRMRTAFEALHRMRRAVRCARTRAHQDSQPGDARSLPHLPDGVRRRHRRHARRARTRAPGRGPARRDVFAGIVGSPARVRRAIRRGRADPARGARAGCESRCPALPGRSADRAGRDIVRDRTRGGGARAERGGLRPGAGNRHSVSAGHSFSRSRHECRTTRSSASAVAPRPSHFSTKAASGTARSAITASASTTRWPAANGTARARMRPRSTRTPATSRFRMSISWSRAGGSWRRWARSPRTRLRAPSSRGSRRKRRG